MGKLLINIYNINYYNVPRDNADMSNDKGIIFLTLSLWYLLTVSKLISKELNDGYTYYNIFSKICSGKIIQYVCMPKNIHIYWEESKQY